MVDSIPVKSLRFLPLTFLAGAHGFAYFAPYAAFVMVVMIVSRRREQQGRLRDTIGPMPVQVAPGYFAWLRVPALAAVGRGLARRGV